ncbi:MAG: hypothetical protein JSR45_14355 [Proteobacteria bacterium]|nr:hypothetical protein [Pseudomonadota bacterium]
MTVSAFTRSARVVASPSVLLAAVLACGAASAQTAPETPPVRSESLGALDLWSAPGRQTDLPPDLWRGASAPLLRGVLEQVGDRPPSPAIAAVARRVLAAGAAAPEGAGADSALAAARARALMQLGDPEAAWAVLARAPQAESSEALSRARVEVALILGHDHEACDTGAALQENRGGLWWLKLRAFCSVLAGQGPAAQVTADLWRQSGGKDPAFERLIADAVDGAGKSAPSAADAIDWALTRKLGWAKDLPVDAAPPGLLAALAADPQTPPTQRHEAVARGLRLGVVPADLARAVYASGLEGEAAPAATVAELAKAPGAEAEARLTMRALRSPDPVERDQAAMAVLARARYAGEFPGLARLIAPALPEIVRSGAAPSDPMLFAAAAALAGDGATADAVRSHIEQDKTPGADAHALALLDAVIALSAGCPAGPVLDRLIDRGGVGDPKLRARAQWAALLLYADGQPLSPEAKVEFAGFDSPPAKASPERLALMARAGQKRAKGETAMLALSIGLQQPTGPTTSDRAAIVAALLDAGLGREAREVAVEGLLVLQRP